MKITKNYDLKAAALDENYLKGNANIMGILDSGYDVAFPGFFKNALPDFLKSGFMPVGHDWGALPIAMPVKAAEEGAALYCEFEFHSTATAQEARTVAKERMEKNLTVGLSVGFDTHDDGTSYFSSGQKLLEHAQGLGCDMSLFDTKGIGAHKGMCRGLLPGGCKELFEVSYVTVPMNRPSAAVAVKGEALGEYAQASAAIAAVDDLTDTFTGRLYGVLYGWYEDRDDEMSADDKIAAVGEMLDEWRATALTIVSALITDEEASEGAKSLLFSLTDRAKIETPAHFCKLLRKAGFSRKEATAVTAHGFTSLRNAGENEDPTPAAVSPPVHSKTTAMLDARFRELSLFKEVFALGADSH